MTFHFDVSVQKFSSGSNALLMKKNGEIFTLSFDTVFVGIGREFILEALQLENAGIEVMMLPVTCNSFMPLNFTDE